MSNAVNETEMTKIRTGMVPHVKEAWVQALLTDRFEQGSGHLADTDGQFCCLGVLCEIAAEEGVVNRVDDRVEGYLYYDGCSQYLPMAVMRWAGLVEEDPLVTLDERWNDWAVDEPNFMELPLGFGQRTTLSDINDKGVPFTQIAGLIERNL